MNFWYTRVIEDQNKAITNDGLSDTYIKKLKSISLLLDL